MVVSINVDLNREDDIKAAKRLLKYIARLVVRPPKPSELKTPEPGQPPDPTTG